MCNRLWSVCVGRDSLAQGETIDQKCHAIRDQEGAVFDARQWRLPQDSKFIFNELFITKHQNKLLKAWDAFKKAKPELSENERPGIYDDEYLHFIIIGLSYGGKDLEAYTVHLPRKKINVGSNGVRASIIDFSISQDVSFFVDLSQDTSLFAQNGVSDGGDYQYDVYRMMKMVASENWSSFWPQTNVY
ncbi:hypothetical protein niasHT_008198 [Heterodera trifolii]|uniref:Uncharacterized protein n=1 Tax=Heterodera trifolii TaxID=157864 RepID=A0ABD2LUC6_9BILA